MLVIRSSSFLWLALVFLHSQMPVILGQSNSSESLPDTRMDSVADGPSATIVFPKNGAVISDSKWTMRLQFSGFQGLSAIVMFGTGQSLNLNSLDTNFALIITDFENGPYDCTVIMLDSNRNPVGGAGEASVSFVVNVSAPAEAGDASGSSPTQHLPRRLNAYRDSRSLCLKVLRIALSYSRSIDAKM
jgi:hypothetical protein